MAISRERRGSGGGGRATVGPLTRKEQTKVAGRHLTELADHQRRNAAQAPVTSMPRARKLGRALQLGWVSIAETVGDAWRWLWNPRHLLGRWKARVRLLRPTKTLSLWLLLLVAFAAVTTLVARGKISPKAPADAVIGSLSGAATVALLALVWNDVFRIPWLSRRIRHQVRKAPDCLLSPNIAARRAAGLTLRLAFTIVARNELYEDLLPGVLARDRKDVQIVVGEPGSGKTTALLDIAKLLARMGIVTVLVPLRAEPGDELVDHARARFMQQVEQFVRSSAEAEKLWRWLCARQRVAILVDDIDQIAPDGERGLVLRQTLATAAASSLPIIVTARPAGVPAGVAASAITLQPLDEDAAVHNVLVVARQDASFGPDAELSHRRVRAWIAEGRLTEAPFYLDLLARLIAVGACPELPAAGTTWTGSEDSGRVRRRPDGEYVWNELWVRFLLLERFYEQTVAGRVFRSLGIERRERDSTMRALERAALGTLVARSLEARLRLKERTGTTDDRPPPRPRRMRIQDYIETNDRGDLVKADSAEEPDDRAAGERMPIAPVRRRREVSAAEIIDTGERLFVLDRDSANEPRFRHRIMQAYLAARSLVVHEQRLAQSGPSDDRKDPVEEAPERERDWIRSLLDHHHPEKLTAHMALTFAALHATRSAHVDERSKRSEQCWAIVDRILDLSIKGADESTSGASKQTAGDGGRPQTVVTVLSEDVGGATLLSVAVPAGRGGDRAAAARRDDDPEPLVAPDPELRIDPDDALMKLTTAVTIADAVQEPGRRERLEGFLAEALDRMQQANGATRWTKLNAIDALKAITVTDPERVRERWSRVWEFARDQDYEVRQAAGSALQDDAFVAFRALVDDVEDLIRRAAVRSAYNRWLTRPDEHLGGNGRPAGEPPPTLGALFDRLLGDDDQPADIDRWRAEKDVATLMALGWVLPAVVSGFREDPPSVAAGADVQLPGGAAAASAGRSPGQAAELDAWTRIDFERRARQALESLVAIAFEGGHEELEAAVAQGFRADAMRHATAPARRITGPGWVTSNRRLVAEICLDHAGYWYARMALYQALALYAVAGADADETLDLFARLVHRGGRDRHPFTQRAARYARSAVRRRQLGSGRWVAFVWSDEGVVAARRSPRLERRAAQLAGDVTVLLNLKEGAEEHHRDAFRRMQELPFCLSHSHDRAEILGRGCPSRCGWGLCPYREPPPDEPNDQRGVSRAFCRQQREIALSRTPSWQRPISRTRLRAFWREMERRARV